MSKPTVEVGEYRAKSFRLPDDQVRWLRRVRTQALAEDVDLDEVTIIREALSRLMTVGAWPELKEYLVARAALGPRRGPSQGRGRS